MWGQSDQMYRADSVEQVKQGELIRTLKLNCIVT